MAKPSLAAVAPEVIPERTAQEGADPENPLPEGSPPANSAEKTTEVDAISAAEASPPPGEPQPPSLSRQHQRWLESVAELMRDAEREVFINLRQDYQRESFIQRFWRARDPFPETSRNEFRERWEANLELARDLFPDFDDARARMMLVNGEPVKRQEIRCGEYLLPLEYWYFKGTLQIRSDFYLVFFRKGSGRKARYELWYPSQGLSPLLAPTLSRIPGEREILAFISEACSRGGEIATVLTSALDWGSFTDRQEIFPDPGDEWLNTFVAYSTDMPTGAEEFSASVELTFPGRFQSRTLVQGLVSVGTDEVGTSNLLDSPSYNFVLDGEILRKDQLFEHFRYRFNLKSSQAEQGLLPLAFQRYLRPGTYTLVLKVEDLNRHAFYRESFDLVVPRNTSTTASRGATAPGAEAAQGHAAASSTAISTRLLQEANTDLPTGDHTVTLLVPRDVLSTGRVRVEAMTRGENIARVRFDLNGKRIFSKSRPPYSVELNLGEAPRVHTLRAVVTDDQGNLLAADEVLINAGPHRFDLRLIEPQAGKTYSQSVRAQAEVEIPEGEHLDRVEFYLNETLIATLFQPPFLQPMVIPDNEPLAFVRAVAYLNDGGSVEDAVFVNAPDFVDNVQIEYVELYTTVLSRRGKQVKDLKSSEVQVSENGVEQTIQRFELVEDVPIHAGILMDVSNSMTQRLEKAVEGTLSFFETVLTPKDRAAVVTFNEEPSLAVRFTNSLEVLAGGLAGLTAEGETALYDALIYNLYYFSGMGGKGAIILLSDGEDVSSRYTFEDVIDYARRTGVAIYPVGISLSGAKNEIRIQLQRLASETGGTSFFVDTANDLTRVFDAIQLELRSQYLISYQSTSEGDDFRKVEVEVSRPGVTAKTQSGYFP
ncbi:MAG: VWA domain-containing protein [Deltaproteobacteria bacterium]|nr:VWA domain-containing protein [Deltaproteobacteria bacterium]